MGNYSCLLNAAKIVIIWIASKFFLLIFCFSHKKTAETHRFGSFLWLSMPVYGIRREAMSVAVLSSEDSQQGEEQVDEVKIEGEGTQQGQFLHLGAGIGSHQQHLLDFLCIVGGETYENQHTYATDNQFKASALDQEGIHQ